MANNAANNSLFSDGEYGEELIQLKYLYTCCRNQVRGIKEIEKKLKAGNELSKMFKTLVGLGREFNGDEMESEVDRDLRLVEEKNKEIKANIAELRRLQKEVEVISNPAD